MIFPLCPLPGDRREPPVLHVQVPEEQACRRAGERPVPEGDPGRGRPDADLRAPRRPQGHQGHADVLRRDQVTQHSGTAT